jgi:hypothetical protein
MLADRDGLLEDRPKRIKGELLPFDAQEMEPLLVELEAHKLIVRYKTSEGSYIQIPKFKAHQTPHYSEKPSGIKPPGLQEITGSDTESKGDDSESTPGALQENSGIKRGSQPSESLLLNPDTGILNPEPGILKATPIGVGSPPKRKARLPDDFVLTPERIARMEASNPAADPEAEFSRFRDHHTAHGSTMADWDAAWRTWCGNSVKFGVSRPAQRHSTLLEHNVAAMQEFIANGAK